MTRDVAPLRSSRRYTLTDVKRHLSQLESTKRACHVMRRTELCKSLWGLPCPLVTVTDYKCSEQDRRSKPVIVITARVHPGETGASWMMQGVLDYVTSNVPRAVELRKRAVLKLVPVLNPDGVAVGNNRTSLCGNDLNRWVVSHAAAATAHAAGSHCMPRADVCCRPGAGTSPPLRSTLPFMPRKSSSKQPGRVCSCTATSMATPRTTTCSCTGSGRPRVDGRS